MKKMWWKISGALLVLYALIYGLLIRVPGDVGMLDETIRNLFYHVPLWFGMIGLLLAAMIYSIMYLVNPLRKYDIVASQLTYVSIVMGTLGVLTGMIWANSTWGKPWTNDPKLNGVAIGMIIYIGYVLLRKSISNKEQVGRISAVYNVFVYPLFIALIVIMPRLAEFSMHPGSGDTVGFNKYDLNNNMRFVFYPAIIGWSLLFLWIGNLFIRYKTLKFQKDEKNSDADVISHFISK
ncbi:MAG: cytochrome c biogenesis protein CcsA [Bacteroidia bacterium]|nr:cytochrome c biogenesis protein CcsA [Bacteroidia bacterium]